MMLEMEGTRKEKKGLESFFLKNLVDLLKSLVATAYVDCTACATCKRLCVEYTTFLRKATYCVRIVRLLRVKQLNVYVIVQLLRVATSSSSSERLFRAI